MVLIYASPRKEDSIWEHRNNFLESPPHATVAQKKNSKHKFDADIKT